MRVFVSSTFRDMQAERDELVKQVFPQIRRLCEQRGVAWSEVDLRWGVTDEQKSEGDVLPICLAEIDRTRPYFIGLVGQRYGWVPDEIPAVLATEMGWLTADPGRSVTELEILHGVLNDPAAAGHSFFYLRDPEWLEGMVESERAMFVEDEPDGMLRLDELRSRLHASASPVRSYSDPVALGELVLADLTALVQSIYSDPLPPDPLARAESVHGSFGRRLRQGFVERPTLAAQLDRFVDGDEEACLVTGEPGSGTSALVTAWAAQRAITHPRDGLFVHHVEADDLAADHRAMVARLLATLSDEPSGSHAEPTAPDDSIVLRSALRQAFVRTSRRTVIVLDGVDRLDDVDGAPDLRWLPDELGDRVRVVVASTGHRPHATFEHRGWPMIEVPPLDIDERRAVAIRFLSRYAKGLDEVHLASLSISENTGNPQYLRLVLDELRQHGDHFTLGERITRLCGAATIDDLIEQVLERYEADFERGCPGLTRAVFTSLWAARRGLAESELLAIVGGGDADRLPQAAWAPLHLAAEDALVVRGGLLGIAATAFRTAVEDRYLASDDDRRAAHAVLADYFAARPLSDRVADELGWQQADAGDTVALRATLHDLAFVEHAYQRSAADVRRLWGRLDELPEAVPGEMVDAYRAVVDDPAAYDTDTAEGAPPRQLVWGVAQLLADNGHPSVALVLQRYLLDRARERPEGRLDVPGGDAALRGALLNFAATSWSSGDLVAARSALEEAEVRCRQADDQAMLASVLGNRAMVERDLGEFDDAEVRFAEEEAICRRLDDRFGLQASLGNRAQLCLMTNRHGEALELLREQESCCRDLADDAGVARARAGRATALAARGDVRAAIELTEQFADSCRAEGDRRGLVEAQLNLASMHNQLGEADIGAALIADAEVGARQFGQPELLARVLVTQAAVVGQLGDWARAERVAAEAELTARSAQLPAQVAQALNVVGTARRELGDLDGARSAHLAEREAAEAAGDRQALAISETNLGNVAIVAQRFDEMYERFAAAEEILRDLDIAALLLPLLANRGQVNQATGRLAEALTDLAGAADMAARVGNHGQVVQWGNAAVALAYQLGDVVRAEALWNQIGPASRELGDDASLQRALGEQALLLINRSQPAGGAADATNVDQRLLDEAMVLLIEQEVVCRRSANDAGLGACLGNRAIVLRFRNDLAGSLACIDEQLAISTRIGDAQGALFATANRGEVLGLLGRVSEGRTALVAARTTAATYGLSPMVQQLDAMIAALHGRN